MLKRISPKRYIYENGNLFLKKINESSHVDFNKNNIKEDLFDKNDIKNINIDFPLLSSRNSNINNNQIFSTQIEPLIPKETNPDEYESNISLTNEKTNEEENDKDKDNDNDIFKRNPLCLRKNIKNINRLKVNSQIEKICKYLYTSPRKREKEDIKFKIFEKEKEFVKGLKKNYLINEDLINKPIYRNRIGIKINQSSKKIFNNNHIYRNFNKNILGDDELIKKYYNEEKSNTIDIDKLTKYRFENYKRHFPKLKHPQIYKLKNINKDIDKNIKLPLLKNENHSPIDLTELIPIKKGIKKVEQRNEYLNYKIMKWNHLEGFHI